MRSINKTFEDFAKYVNDNYNDNKENERISILTAINNFCYEEDIDFHTDQIEEEDYDNDIYDDDDDLDS
jgi:hypothetical protein